MKRRSGAAAPRRPTLAPGTGLKAGWGYGDGLAIISLVGMTVVVFWRLALTELVIGRGDILYYFYPYRDFASAAVRAGCVPLWNPYLFMGVPFVANPQAGFFYPLNLALAWLPVERMVNASIVIHAALAGVGAFLWGRGGLGLGRPGAWLTALCYGLGGYFVAQVEHLNQVQVLAWLPWLLWLYESRDAGLAPVIALQFLAGHTQSVFICLVGLASYALLPPAWDLVRRQIAWRRLVRPFCVVVGTTVGGGALAAIQLLPTWELSRLSVRSGGLPYQEAVSFSLRPELVGRALLPSWDAPLFPEFVAHVGVAGLGLAVLGILVRPASRAGGPYSRRGAAVLTVVGLVLALGGFNPLYFVLVKLVPGFGLFRAPARWLALYAVGAAGLAGLGLDQLVAVAAQRPVGTAARNQRLARRWRGGLIATWGTLAGLVIVGQLLGQPELVPSLGLQSIVGWFIATLSFGSALYLARSTHFTQKGAPHASPTSQLATTLAILVVSVELWGASLLLPFNRATAPGALKSLRPAIAHLLAEAEAMPAGPPARFLSISDIFFDPGDKPEIELALEPQLSSDALYDYIIATKQKEVLIPNLPLYYRLPTVDGYDGGVLPLYRYVTLERLYMPEERVALDGRLRENLEAVPDGRWLSLFNVRFVITDKVGDAWFDGVFYDLQMGARLRAGDAAAVGHVPPLAATALGIVYRADGAAAGTALAEVELVFADEQRTTLSLLADAAGNGDRVARLSWGQVGTLSAIDVRGAWEAGEVTIRGLSLIDERSDAFQSLILSDNGHYRLVHSGDVKIYENLDALPRAFFVAQAVVAPDDEAALAAMRDPNFDPSTTIVLADHTPTDPSSQSHLAHPAETEFLIYEPERVVVTVNAPTAGWLLLSDAWYPGWKATVDGQSSTVKRADILFRAVAVPAGEHRVEWSYRPASFRLGKAISLGTWGILLLGGIWIGVRGAVLKARAAKGHQPS